VFSWQRRGLAVEAEWGGGMSEWNFSMDAAPRGETRMVKRIVGKNEIEVSEHIPALIIAAGNDMIVTVSKWLPEQGRWNMFSKLKPPKAWQHWPTHPEYPV